MNAQVLIDSVVRQITVLIAQLATSGGIRAPVAHLANQVFVELARELESQGVSRKVSADMFGMALRAYIRKVRRLSEGQTERGRTLWQALLDFIRQEKMVSRARVLSRFSRDDELSLSSVLHDLTESGLVFASGSGDRSVFRAASDSELGELSLLSGEEGLDELLWVIIYREGPLGDAALAERLSRPADQLQPALGRLMGDGRVQRSGDAYTASSFVVPLGSPVGWEAAVFDHLQAVVQTICQRLSRMSGSGAATGGSKSDSARDTPIGGSTYSFDIWPGHPLEGEVKGQLDAIRARCGELRCRVDAHNAEHGLTGEYQQIITYVGQCRLDKEADRGGDAVLLANLAHPGKGDNEEAT
jgi:hypothetical protein